MLSLNLLVLILSAIACFISSKVGCSLLATSLYLRRVQHSSTVLSSGLAMGNHFTLTASLLVLSQRSTSLLLWALDRSRNSSILPNFRFSVLRYARKFLLFTVGYCLKSCLPCSETAPNVQVLRCEPVVRMKGLLPRKAQT